MTKKLGAFKDMLKKTLVKPVYFLAQFVYVTGNLACLNSPNILQEQWPNCGYFRCQCVLLR